MRFSICVMADVDEIDFFSHAESLGYDAVWVTDSQMLFSDCYAVLALAARQTSRLRLGPGVAICGTRIPPVHVAAMATLNRLAPGRVFLAVGTGNTATRAMGRPGMRIADYARYLRVLLRGAHQLLDNLLRRRIVNSHAHAFPSAGVGDSAHLAVAQRRAHGDGICEPARSLLDQGHLR
jgi:alkanesulfonate monooxygenase SsuD/methylene tetrahydromethanopterin reductase-like flavin-dependent oxidoreductase (luciferase family)